MSLDNFRSSLGLEGAPLDDIDENAGKGLSSSLHHSPTPPRGASGQGGDGHHRDSRLSLAASRTFGRTYGEGTLEEARSDVSDISSNSEVGEDSMGMRYAHAQGYAEGDEGNDGLETSLGLTLGKGGSVLPCVMPAGLSVSISATPTGLGRSGAAMSHRSSSSSINTRYWDIPTDIYLTGISLTHGSCCTGISLTD